MRTAALTSLIVAIALTGVAAGQDEPAPAETAPAAEAAPDPGPTQAEMVRRLGSLAPLLQELDRLSEEVRTLRAQLAGARMGAAAGRAEVDEMQAFLADHHEYGRDFQEYRAVKQAAGVDARRRQVERNRAELQKKKADREKRRRQLKAKREKDRAEADRLKYYRDRGFSPIGLDVFLSRMAYNYSTSNGGNVTSRLAYRRGIGRYQKFYPTPGGYDIDFTTMTISGSLLNATDTTRNIGIAVTFFDDNGSQVGQETVRVNNARPDVPYPFTAEVKMAAGQPFATSSQYVLYADPVAEAP